MDEVIQTKTETATATATAAFVGVKAALAIGHAVWPADEPVYVTTQNVPSFSFFEKTITFSKPKNTHEFAKDIASVFASLSEGQEPLGSEFEAVWDANLAELYES